MSGDHSDSRLTSDVERSGKLASAERQKFNWKRYTLGWIYPLICFILILIAFVCTKNALDLTDLPSDNELYNPKEGFSAARAQKHLNALAQSPRGFNSPNNEKALEYIINQVKELQGKTDRISYLHDNSSQLAIPQGTKYWGGEASLATYFVTSNFVVKFKGTNSNGRAIMLSPHYDSSPVAPGATDAGVGVSVSLEILEALIQSPPEGYDVMVNFNNAEELGSLGSFGFEFHPWVKDVDSFINLEGSGFGGKALLFQSSSSSLTRALTAGPYHHGNALGNDLFSMGIISSGTDYEIYKKKYNLPGVDIAVYRNRAFYHTTKDDLAHASIATTHQMGNFAYQGVKNIGKYGLSKNFSKVIAFDFLNSTPVYTFASFYALIALFYVFEIVLFAAYLLKIRHIQPLFTEGKPVIQILKGLLFSIVGILFAVLFGFIIIKITNVANPNVVHTYPVMTFVLMIIVSFWCQIGAHLIWIRWDRSYSSNSLQMGSWLGVLILYNVLVIIQLATHIMGISFLLFLSLQAWSILGAFILYLLFGSHMNLANSYIFTKFNSGSTLKIIGNKVQPTISFFVNYFFSAIVITGLGLPLLYAIHQGAPTGTWPYLPYILSLLFTTIICIPLSPNLLAMRHLLHIFILLTALLIIICPILWTRFPYSESSPLPVSYSRFVELDPNSLNVTSSKFTLNINGKPDLVVGGIGLTPKTRQQVFQGSNVFEIFSYDSDTPKLADYSQYKPKLANYTKSGDNVYRLQFEFNAPESKICRLEFAQPVTNLQVAHLNSEFISMQTPSDSNAETDGIKLLRNNNKLPWTLKFEHHVNTTDISFQMSTTCYLEDSNDLEELIKKTPSWTSIWTRDLGQLGIKTKYTFKPTKN